ncbi:MAG: SDR family oxidoreductase [Chloroflexi bacterium]|nr:SDR family oxidoreductase [Chloroflexota bacterium]
MSEGNRRVAIVTGASRGLGETLAGFLAGSGYDLVLNARDSRVLEETAARLRRFETRIHTVAGNIGDAGVRRAMVAAAGDLGGLNLLVNNASDLGVSPLPPLVEYPVEELAALYQTNVFAPLALIQEALALLRAQGGLVVNVSSDAALGGYEGWGAYGSSKAALDLVSKTLANELRPAGIGVVSVDPGDMRTQMHQQAYPGEDISDRPLPEVTMPFWAWLLGQPVLAVSGGRYAAQAVGWEAQNEAV